MVAPHPPMPGVPGLGEFISTQLHGGTGSSSFYAAAAELESVASQLTGIFSGGQANAGALSSAWQGGTGETAVAANQPYQAWLTAATSHLTTAAGHIATAGQGFDTAQAMTRTPGEFSLLNWTGFTWMQINPLVLGMLTPAIVMNRMLWAGWTLLAAGGMSQYTGASAPLQSHPSMPTPPPSANPASGPISAALAAGQPAGQAVQGSAASALQPLSAATSLLSNPGALFSSGGQAAAAPSMASGLTSMPMASGLTSMPMMASQFAGMPMMASGLAGPAMASTHTGLPTAGSAGAGAAGADAANWYGTGGGRGAVTATLSGGGGGLGGGAAAAPLQGPGSWSSTVSAATPALNANEVAVSRIAEARAATTMPTTAAGMGGGGMVPPMWGGRQPTRDQAVDQALDTAAALYRGPPSTVPVVTGEAGAHFPVGGEVDP